MSSYYIDSSVMFKLYADETGSDEARSMVNHAQTVLTSILTDLELISVIERAKREARINSPLYRQLISEIQRDIRSGAITYLDMTPDIFNEAKRIIKQRRLRVPDALQLASAVIANHQSHDQLTFLCADHALIDAARLEGLRWANLSGK